MAKEDFNDIEDRRELMDNSDDEGRSNIEKMKIKKLRKRGYN